MTTQPSFLIVGGGLAGAIAAQTLREEGFDGSITLLGQEPHRPYERPPCRRTTSRARLTATASSPIRRPGTPTTRSSCVSALR
jgi:NADPH-dependent 2,4-dienoyl-CoA reductase/sulfur reductase-like enzyme